MASEGKHLVGVDIGSSSIKVCEVREGRGGRRELVGFGYHPLPAETIVDGHVLNSSAVVEGLEKLFHKKKDRNVALRASGHSVIIKKITMPRMTAAELGEQIGWEAEQHIPFDLSEVQIDYQVLGERAETAQMDVLLVAAKREEISDLTNLATEARLKPMVVDLDAFTVQNVFEAGYGQPSKSETVVLIHSGSTLSTVNILANGSTAFTRDIANGGNAITDEIQRRLGVDRSEAEAYKCGEAVRGFIPREVGDVVQQVVEQVAGEIQRSLDFYLATSGDRDLSRIYLSGGTANVAPLLDAIHRRSRVPVEKLDPLLAAPPDARTVDMNLLAARASQATVAIGLALRKERERR